MFTRRRPCTRCPASRRWRFTQRIDSRRADRSCAGSMLRRLCRGKTKPPRLHQHDVSTTALGQQIEQPVIEAADFHDRCIPAPLGKLHQELRHRVAAVPTCRRCTICPASSRRVVRSQNRGERAKNIKWPGRSLAARWSENEPLASTTGLGLPGLKKQGAHARRSPAWRVIEARFWLIWRIKVRSFGAGGRPR